MTYWYIGIEEAVSVLKQLFQKTPIALGVFYATLCSNHAKTLNGITNIITGNLSNLNKIFSKYNINAYIKPTFNEFPSPDYSFYTNLEYIAIRMSLGCPFNCTYCAQKYLNDNYYTAKKPESIKKKTNNQIKNFIFIFQMGYMQNL